MGESRFTRRLSLAAAVVAAAFAAGAAGQLLAACGPFADVDPDSFCPFVIEIFTVGITTGTTPTTYDPTAAVSRLQMAAFLSRTVDGVVKRGSRRLAMRQLWTVTDGAILPTATLDSADPQFVEFDGADLWVSEASGARLARFRASDGKLLETWTGLTDFSEGILLAMGKVFVVGGGSTIGPTGRLYRIDPALPAGAATTVASGLAGSAIGIAFDGAKIFVTNYDGTVSVVTPAATVPWTVTTVAGGYQFPRGILFDGSSIWITDQVPAANGTLLKLNSSAGVVQTVTVGAEPGLPVFDGTNIWVPNEDDNSISVVRASNGSVLATLTGNGLSFPRQAAFDGQRVLVTSNSIVSPSVSVWKAADLTSLGSTPAPAGFFPFGAASDGVNFWITLQTFSGLGKLVRF